MAAVKNTSAAAAAISAVDNLCCDLLLKKEVLRGQNFFVSSSVCASTYSSYQLASPKSQLVDSLLLCLPTLDLDRNTFAVY